MANLFYADCYLRLMKKGDLQFETARDNLQGKNYNSKYTNGNTNNLFIPLSISYNYRVVGAHFNCKLSKLPLS